ncbi:MAG: NAD-dependent succinate-semialdehyde dehydrogenase [Rhodospirillaceae bacterium]
MDMFIDGEWRRAISGQTFDVRNPATGEILASVPDGSREDAEQAILAAHGAFPSWAGLTAYDRSKILYRAYQLMLSKREELAKTMTREQGKPLRSAGNEVQYGADFLLWYAEEAKRICGETIPSSRADQRFLVAHQPVGVVGAITPWNYPISMITRKLSPALAAGCTIVLKPAEATPLCAIEIFKIFEEAGVPPGVINLVTALDPEPIGDEFIVNPFIRKITFTGSTEVGKQLASGAGAHMKRISMELGGHAPFLVLKDADPIHAAKGAALVKFLNTGQACICPNRIFVHQSSEEDFSREFVARVTKLRAGNGLEPGISIGPLINFEAIEKAERQVEDAIKKGARLLLGGNRLSGSGYDTGYFFEPTILSNVTRDMLIYRQETFGPIAPIISFSDDDDLLGMANDTNFGLAAYVYTQNLSAGMRTFEGLHFGIIGINDINPTSAAVPFGGMKESGIGREGGHEGLFDYLETKIGGFSI